MIKVTFTKPIEISQHNHVSKVNFITCFTTTELASFTYMHFSTTDINDRDFCRTNLIKSIEFINPTEL